MSKTIRKKTILRINDGDRTAENHAKIIDIKSLRDYLIVALWCVSTENKSNRKIIKLNLVQAANGSLHWLNTFKPKFFGNLCSAPTLNASFQEKRPARLWQYHVASDSYCQYQQDTKLSKLRCFLIGSPRLLVWNCTKMEQLLKRDIQRTPLKSAAVPNITDLAP